ncbi:MAG TPA: hypothetical protein PLN96_05425 [Zoogloea sp.]|uniref:hypothetical protein n=1 Tax=Zoogloea sp. TaxID=49181 RepID=UPI002BAFCB97|nr:hypothetical protein [Zoogloea sp.]HMV17946.1 hypothetical protein [Rhodocyclaceae bacterium]HMV62082.1 hypothetical protein [Rhodocyclaceae bacterium]HMW52348.1 hypothetical protein [Rhodocyclaceae bacterium]HMY50659.1 hypothetical protein [Rhodocyclaceae bacterium]HMZ75530.1 hypothetical protein [Rhodocyclaceae bacterium]
MFTRISVVPAALAAAFGVTVLAGLTGCEHPKPPAPAASIPEPDLKDVAKRFVDPSYAVGALVIGKNGEVLPVSAEGKRIQPCLLPKAPETPTAKAPEIATQGEIQECPKARDTTILDVQSVAVVRHTGSTCVTVGGGVFMGRVMPVYQVCY